MRALITTLDKNKPVALAEAPEPVPAANEAVVAVRAFSLNRGELPPLLRADEIWRPGQDIAGVIARAAANGAGPPEGARVVGIVDETGWSERVAVPVHRLAVLPEQVSFAAAATLPIAGLTALRTLRFGEPLLGRRVLVSGASGGVGQFAVQLAARSGAYVTAIAGRGGRGAADLAKLGASEVVGSIDDAKGPFALALDSVGGETLVKALRLLGPKGTVAVFGNTSREPTTLSFGDFAAGQNTRIASFHSFTAEPDERFGPDLAILVSLVADGSLKPLIGVERSWRDFLPVALELRDRKFAGKAVFRVD
jgi:NADPH:quinone reductase-like Zn-dependent oxidoreductase